MSDSNTAVHGRELFETCYWLVEELILCLSRRHRLGTEEREDFTSYAMLKLVENDYARLRKYRGHSSLKTYLTVVLHHLFLDYRAQKWGKWRPSSTARRLGELAVMLETLLYRDGHGFHEAREMLLTSTATTVTGEELWELANQLPHRMHFHRLEERTLYRVISESRDADVDRRERRSLVRNLESRLWEAIGELSDEERRILRLRFDEEMSVPEIAAALKLEPKPLYARIGRLLKRLKAALVSAGVGRHVLEEIVGWRELQMDFDRIFAMPHSPAPSV